MWNLIGNNLGTEIKTASRGLPLFTLVPATGIPTEQSSNSLFASQPTESDEVIEDPTLIKESEGFIYIYPLTVNLPAYAKQTTTNLNSFNHYYSSGGKTVLYVENKLVSNPTIELVEEIYTSNLEANLSDFTYSVILEKDFQTISKIYTEGLIYLPDQFSYNSATKLLTIDGSPSCRPRIEDPFSVVEISGTVNITPNVYKTLIFDFSDTNTWGNIQSIESLDWQNKTFIKSFQISNFGLLYNTSSKKAICTWQ